MYQNHIDVTLKEVKLAREQAEMCFYRKSVQGNIKKHRIG